MYLKFPFVFFFSFWEGLVSAVYVVGFQNSRILEVLSLLFVVCYFPINFLLHWFKVLFIVKIQMLVFYQSNYFEQVWQALLLPTLCPVLKGELTEKVGTTGPDVLIIKLSPQLAGIFKPGFLPAYFFHPFFLVSSHLLSLLLHHYFCFSCWFFPPLVNFRKFSIIQLDFTEAIEYLFLFLNTIVSFN